MLELFVSAEDRGAELSTCRRYRYRLWRRWGDGPGLVVIGLNPSTADETADDPTIRRCVSKARSLGLPSLTMVNLFAFRSTDPRALMDPARAQEVVGPENDAHLLAAALAGAMVLCAWGVHGRLLFRDRAVTKLLRGAGLRLHVLRLTKGGHPQHPLYLPEALRPVEWTP